MFKKLQNNVKTQENGIYNSFVSDKNASVKSTECTFQQWLKTRASYAFPGAPH